MGPDQHIAPFILQLVGLAMLVVFIAFWFITGQESALLVGASLALIGVGSASNFVITVRRDIEKGGPEVRITEEKDES